MQCPISCMFFADFHYINILALPVDAINVYVSLDVYFMTLSLIFQNNMAWNICLSFFTTIIHTQSGV